MSVVVQGADRLDRKLRAFQQGAMRPAGKTASVLSAQAAQADAQRLAPRDTGELARSIRVLTEGETAVLIASAEHAMPVEFGTLHTRAQPFFRPAVSRQRAPARQRYRHHGKIRLLQVAGGIHG